MIPALLALLLQAPLTVQEYSTGIDQLAARISSARVQDAAQLCASVDDTRRVIGEHGSYEVNLRWLRAELCNPALTDDVWETARNRMAGRLRAMAREASLPATASRSDVNARDTLNRILAQRAFTRSRVESWQAIFMRQVRDWIAKIWQRTLGRAIGARTLATGLAGAAAAAAVLVLIVWLLRLSSQRRAERPISIGPMGVARLPGHVLGEQAAVLIGQGDIREGARLAYQAALSRLHEEGALRADDARTPRESLRLLPDPHRRRPALARLTAIFERAWYGARAPAAESGDEILRLLRELECLSFDRAKQA